VAHAKRWTRLFSGAGLAVAAALAGAGCTSAPASTTSGSTASQTGTAPALTAAQARQVFDNYVVTTDKAARTGDRPLALSVVTGVQQAIVATTLKEHSYVESSSSSDGQGTFSGSIRIEIKPAYNQYAYGTPTFYLPQQAGYPRFFVADLTQTLKGTSRTYTVAPGVGGARVPVDGRALMLFEQASATAPWLLASISKLAAGVTVPRLATDSAGYVPTVPLDAAALLARPDVVGPLQAAVVDDGPASAAAKAVASGPLTTGMYQAARTSAQGLKAPAGDVYQWELEGSHYPKFALRAADGSALVFYAMYLNSTVEVPAVLNKSYPIRPGPPITVPLELLTLLPPGKTAPRVRLESQELLSFAAVDPPSGNGKIQVVAIGGGLSYAMAS
jgi:hypothetical protein